MADLNSHELLSQIAFPEEQPAWGGSECALRGGVASLQLKMGERKRKLTVDENIAQAEILKYRTDKTVPFWYRCFSLIGDTRKRKNTIAGLGGLPENMHWRSWPMVYHDSGTAWEKMEFPFKYWNCKTICVPWIYVSGIYERENIVAKCFFRPYDDLLFISWKDKDKQCSSRFYQVGETDQIHRYTPCRSKKSRKWKMKEFEWKDKNSENVNSLLPKIVSRAFLIKRRLLGAKHL